MPKHPLKPKNPKNAYKAYKVFVKKLHNLGDKLTFCIVPTQASQKITDSETNAGIMQVFWKHAGIMQVFC